MNKKGYLHNTKRNKTLFSLQFKNRACSKCLSIRLMLSATQTSCRRAAATICLSPLQVDNIFVFIRQVAPVLVCWLLRHRYLCANFSLPRPLCSRVRPNVRDRRQTDRRQTKASLRGRRHNKP